MVSLLLLLIPIFFTGLIIVRISSYLKRIELILPTSLIIGFGILIFILNSTAFVVKGEKGILIAYIITAFLGLLLQKLFNIKIFSDLEFLKGKRLWFWIASIFFWGGLILWKANHALIGSDTNLYYSIAHTFLKGNFPPVTPWQADLPLAYHLGVFELLGAFHFLTNLSFEFLHLILASIFIFCTSQIIIWFWKSKNFLMGYLYTNLISATLLISFGFLKIIIPIFPLEFPRIQTINQLIIWLRDLPTVSQSIEVYGAPVELDSLIYFIFHPFGLALFLALLVLVIYPDLRNKVFNWAVILLGLAILALTNESIFLMATPTLLIGILITEFKNHSLKKDFKILLTLLIFLSIVIFFQGGIISESLSPNKKLDSSILLFPQYQNLNEDLKNYHIGQQQSKLFDIKTEWLPFRWYHVGIDVLLVVSLILVAFIKTDNKKRFFLQLLFLSGLFAFISYNAVIPKFLAANGNRLLVFSYIFLSLTILFSLTFLWLSLKLNKYKLVKYIMVIIFLWLFLPTILPPLALLSKTRFGENKLVPRGEQYSAGIEWIRENIPYNERVMGLDSRAPHPSGVARIMVQGGVFSPIFPGDFRAYTIEASPEYIDIAYTLSPFTLSKLGISTLLIDGDFYNSLPKVRQDQLNNEKYFTKIFDYPNNQNEWEKVFKIEEEYLKSGGELGGTLESLSGILPKQAKIYVDNEENFKYNFLRRPVIFILRDRDLYYFPQSGVYLNVEAYINQKNPQKDTKYDFLILGNNTNPVDICQCKSELLWKGLNNQVVLWRSEYFGKVEK